METIHSKAGLATINKITASGFRPEIAAETKIFVSITTLILRDDKPQFLQLFPPQSWGCLRVLLAFL